MRRFLAVIGVCAVLLGLRFMDNGLLNSGFSGTYTVFNRDGSEQVFLEDSLPVLDRFNAYATRLDVTGGAAEAVQILKNLNAQTKWCEQIDRGLTVVYAYSPEIFRHETVLGTKINLMVAYGGDDRVAVGCPLLMGSY